MLLEAKKNINKQFNIFFRSINLIRINKTVQGY